MKMPLKVMLFTAPWNSRPEKIKELIVVIDRIVKSIPDIEFINLDLSEDSKLATALKIRATPIIFFEKDNNIVGSMGINGPEYLSDEQVLIDKIEELK